MPPEQPEVAGEGPSCTFGRCSCRWLGSCSSRIPPVAPGRDYYRVPLGADDKVAWSLLVGFLPPSSAGTTSLLRLRRFCVAQSGRILGRSDDALEILDDVDYDARDKAAQISVAAATPGANGDDVDYDAKGKSAQISAAAATPGAKRDDVDYDARGKSAQISVAAATPCANGRSLALCRFCLDFGVPGADGKVEHPRPVELILDLSSDRRIYFHSLPPLPLPLFMPFHPISASGDIWVPCSLNNCSSSSLVMLRLDKESEQWVKVATMEVAHCVICGYAVVHDTILLSLKPPDLFIVFNCSTCGWTAVKTNRYCSTYACTLGQSVTDYIPIYGRGLYVEEDDTIYFLCDSIIYAYKLCQDQDECQYQMALPTIIDRLCPFGDQGSGFLTHLGGRVMCFIWISMPFCDSELRCDCDTCHVLITTFRVIGDSRSNHEHFVPKGVQVLHSTCRRLDIDPSKSSVSDYKFCFLQEYEENALPPAKKKRENEMTPSMSGSMEFKASSNVVESSKMLTCCREFFNQSHFICALRLENSVIQTTKDLYVICQGPSYSTVFKITIVDGKLACHNQNLKAYGTMDTFVCADPDDLTEEPFPWHFICDSSSIYAVEDKTATDIHSLSLDSGISYRFDATRPSGVDFSIALVLAVGSTIIAISDTLALYVLSDTYEWKLHIIEESVDLEKKVELSGFVVLSEKSFVICDAETNCYFLFDLCKNKRSIVKAYSNVSGSLPTSPAAWSGSGFLSGRSVFAEGFIYTCAERGLQAYEIIKLQDSYYLGQKISLEFSWNKYWDRNRMCLDYVGQDTASGVIMFCVVQGNNYHQRPDALHKHPLLITTIQVKTERTSRDTLQPVAVGHVSASTSFIDLAGGPIWTRSCFALSLSRMEE